MKSVTTAELGKRIAELLDLKDGERFEIAKLRSGQVLAERVEEPQT